MTIRLPPDLDRALESYAAKRGLSKAEAVRRAIAGWLPPEPRPGPFPRIRAIGVISGPGDVSSKHDLYLTEGDFGSE
jgi:hypothetical protein